MLRYTLFTLDGTPDTEVVGASGEPLPLITGQMIVDANKEHYIDFSEFHAPIFDQGVGDGQLPWRAYNAASPLPQGMYMLSYGGFVMPAVCGVLRDQAAALVGTRAGRSVLVIYTRFQNGGFTCFPRAVAMSRDLVYHTNLFADDNTPDNIANEMVLWNNVGFNLALGNQGSDSYFANWVRAYSGRVGMLWLGDIYGYQPATAVCHGDTSWAAGTLGFYNVSLLHANPPQR